MNDPRSSGAHIQAAETLLHNAEEVTAANLLRGDRSPTDALLAALTHAVVALVKIEMEKRL